MQHLNELSDCGLNDGEQEILFFLLQFGPRSAGYLAKKLALKRPTVYSMLERLVDMQLVSKRPDGKTLIFQAASPKEIPDILLGNERKRYDRVKTASDRLRRHLADFGEHAKTTLGSFDFELIESSERYGELLMELLPKKNHWSIWNPQVGIYDKRIQERVLLYLAQSAKRGIQIRELLIEGQITDWYTKNITNKNHLYKIVKDKILSSADLCMIEDETTIISLNASNAESALVLRNSDVFAFLRRFFVRLWESLPSDVSA